MLELPESHTIASQMTTALEGRVVEKVIANHSPHSFTWYYGDPIHYDAMLKGKTVGKTYARSGMIEAEIGDMRLLLGDGAFPRFWEADAACPKKHQLYIKFEDGAFLTASVQMYGGIQVFPEGNNKDVYYLKACQTVSPLQDAFNEEYFTSLLGEKEQKLSAKAFLATEQRIPGLGNGVLQDILFDANIHPKQRMNTLAPAQLSTLYHSMKNVLAEMTINGGRDTERDLFGNNGGYNTRLSKKTLLYPCPACGGSITKTAYLGGAVYFCQACQPLTEAKKKN